MNEQEILEQLLELLEANSVVIRSEPLGGSGGGFCTIKGQRFFFVDTEACVAETSGQAAEAVEKTVDIESVYVKPQVRRFIESRLSKNQTSP